MLTTHVVNNISVEVITRNTNRLVTNNTTQCNYRNFGGTTTYINDHITHWLFNIDTNTDCCSHRFMDKIYFFCSGNLSRVTYSTFLYFGNTRRYTDNHTK
ncbi:hypothetical protein D3C80_1361270 [compost metagenome]